MCAVLEWFYDTIRNMKTCFKCGISKDVEEFYRHSGMADGRLGKCKECCKSDNTANRNKKIDYYREYDRERSELPHRVESRTEYLDTPEGRKKHKAGAKAWAKRKPRKRAAQTLFRNRLRSRPELGPKPCNVCGTTIKVDAHHEDYDKPLDVVWYCRQHHMDRHKEMRRLGIKP